KTVICDNRSLLTGGTCFLPRMEDWRDTMVRVDGGVARQAAQCFEETWRYTEGESPFPHDPESKAPADQPDGWRYLVSSPFPSSRRDYYDLLLERIEQAEERISFVTPYLLPVRRYWDALRPAIERGVSVRLIIPAKSDHTSVDLAGRIFVHSMKHAGVEVYGYEPTMVHAKLALIDEQFSAVGSFNLGIDSFKMNLEGAVVTGSKRFAAARSTLRADRKRFGTISSPVTAQAGSSSSAQTGRWSDARRASGETCTPAPSTLISALVMIRSKGNIGQRA
ncbi:MAG TPA: phospholipase D-like domain-containing protein, partial [Pseudorhizobium sp.]|nr:phospholipase D-like domain-containing protein [Pseudorhizobium sp.]